MDEKITLERTITVTITLDQDGHAAVEFYDNESGDCFTISGESYHEIVDDDRVGTEIGSWLELMADELDET